MNPDTARSSFPVSWTDKPHANPYACSMEAIDMQSIRRLVVILLLAALTVPVARAAIGSSATTPTRPQPELTLAPEDVVSIVVRALANNDDPYPDAGIETTFRFASPQNRANTGPLDRFGRMVKAHPYGDMVNHRHSDISEVVYVGDEAYLLVKLIARDGREVAYAFRLSQQHDGEYRGMWMTDAVWPVNKP